MSELGERMIEQIRLRDIVAAVWDLGEYERWLKLCQQAKSQGWTEGQIVAVVWLLGPLEVVIIYPVLALAFGSIAFKAVFG